VAEQPDATPILMVVGSREHGLLEPLLGPPVDESVARRFRAGRPTGSLGESHAGEASLELGGDDVR
jgi:hypothetical protein